MATFLLPADELEYAVLATLWELGAASVRELHDQLGEPAGRVYTTTAKVIDRLRGKGLIARQRRGKAFVYRPKVARLAVENARAKQAVSRLLGATPRAAVAALVDAVEAFDPELLDELERAVNARRRSKRGTRIPAQPANCCFGWHHVAIVRCVASVETPDFSLTAS